MISQDNYERYLQADIRRFEVEKRKQDLIDSLPFGLRMARTGFMRSNEKIKVGAAYVEGGLIVIGSNHRKSSPILLKYGYPFVDSIHAETMALARVDNCKHGVVYVYRETRNGGLAMSRPCEACMRLLHDRGVRRMIYTVAGSWQEEKV